MNITKKELQKIIYEEIEKMEDQPEEPEGATSPTECIPPTDEHDLGDPQDQEEVANEIAKERNVEKKTAWEIVKSLAKLGLKNRRIIGSVLTLLLEKENKGKK